jgi:hypothetical protein
MVTNVEDIGSGRQTSKKQQHLLINLEKVGFKHTIQFSIRPPTSREVKIWSLKITPRSQTDLKVQGNDHETMK